MIPRARALSALLSASSILLLGACLGGDPGEARVGTAVELEGYLVTASDVARDDLVLDLSVPGVVFVFEAALRNADLSGITIICPNGMAMNFSAWIQQQVAFGNIAFDRRQPGPFAISSGGLIETTAFLERLFAVAPGDPPVGPGGPGGGPAPGDPGDEAPDEAPAETNDEANDETHDEANDEANTAPDEEEAAASTCRCFVSCFYCPDGLLWCPFRCEGCTVEELEEMGAFDWAGGVWDDETGQWVRLGDTKDDSMRECASPEECEMSPLKPIPGGDPSPMDGALPGDPGAPGGAEPGAPGPGSPGGPTPAGPGEGSGGGGLPGESGGGSSGGGSSGGSGGGGFGGSSGGSSGGGSSGGSSGGSGGSSGTPW